MAFGNYPDPECALPLVVRFLGPKRMLGRGDCDELLTWFRIWRTIAAMLEPLGLAPGRRHVETLPGRISGKTGRHSCQQAHMLASKRRRPIVVARRWRIIRRSIRSIIRRGCVVGWPGGRPPRRCQTGRAGGQVGK